MIFSSCNRKYGCVLELGGDDQWSNIIGGVELIRRKEQKEAYGMTFNLLLTSEGKKMGKTEKGAVWLDPEKTSPYEFYQYWRNVDDADVINCMKMLTFVPLEEIREYAKLEGGALNPVKERLAFELTALIHGLEEAEKAQAAARALFGGGADDSNMPTTALSSAEFGEGMPILDLMLRCGLIPSKGEGRRLIQQGGVSLNGEKATDPLYVVTAADFADGGLKIKKGKKVFHRVTVE